MKTQTLYFKEGSSDKVYTARLEDAPDGQATLLLSWGRRGNGQQSQVLGPMPPAEAEKLYEKKLKDKLAKGYQPGESGAAMVAAGTTAPANVPRPMLLNEIDRDEVERLIRDPGWWMQEKYDGCRILLERNGDSVTAWSRTGKQCAALPQAVVDAALATTKLQWVMDGEIVGDEIWAFDLLRERGDNLSGRPYDYRFALLQNLLITKDTTAIHVAFTAQTIGEKRALIAAVEQTGGEGIVLRDSRAAYSPGRPSSGGPALKFKFVKSASVIVESVNTQRSVNVRAVCGTPLGRVTIPPNYPVPAVGAVVEVRYLTIHRGGALIQAVYLGERTDIPAEECTLDQLQFKPEVEE